MQLIRFATVFAFALVVASTIAQSYPNKPIRWILGFPPGGSGDVLCRMLGAKLSEALDQPVVVENRSGAAGNIGMELAAKSPADGHTVAFVHSDTHSINPSLYSKMPFAESDFAPVIWLSSVPLMIVVSASQPVTTVKELIALARAWNGVHVPAGTPAEIIRRLNTELNKIITAPEMRSRMIASGFEPVGGEPERLSELIRTETMKWAKVVKATGMKVD